MRRATPIGSLLVLAMLPASAEIIDRVAVTMGRTVITQSAVEEQVRVTAFLNQEPLDLGPLARRRAADRMIEQTLLRQEMEFSGYVLPGHEQAEPLLAEIRKERFPDEDSFLRTLASYGITESILRRHLILQLGTLRFIELRFRPGVAVGDGEIEIYYREQFVPGWERRNNSPPPALEDAAEEVESILVAERTDQALNQWLNQSRRQTRVRFVEEAIQ
ncbi:MAG: hypothetical protein FJW20_10855 [Acidimicrobiia bacterium]|nr:hypothetical protein [Acidimicrobiia bacterium]